MKAARNLKLPFVGVGAGLHAERLRSAGAQVVVPDFENLEATIGCLESAPVPITVAIT